VTDPPSPLEPQRFFAQTWQGEGELAPRGLLAHLPGARRFSFRSFTTMVSEDFWIVHDETRWEDGRIELRDGLCRRLDETTLRMTYNDMLGGTEVRLRSDGYDLGPYAMLVSAPGLPLRLPVRCTDSCRLEPDGTLVDSIDLTVLGVRVGRQIIHLRARSER
jgi:hypothetical protein